MGIVTSVAVAQPPVAPEPDGAPAAVAAAPGGAPAAIGQQQGDPRVLDQGPIHEAFAEPVALDAKARVIVDRAPPDLINELPPEVKPEGDRVEWIPGYWMWSDEQLDFVWVSGVWRDLPPGRRWVPGHWLAEGNRFIWASGFWAGADARQVQMLPHPPATLEAGPSSPAPGENFFWVPGCWIWSNNAYAWRTGYWYAGQDNWVWVPDYYSYTPAGVIFVSGYWDRPLWTRGLLYAPVYWPAGNYGYAGFYYRPSYAVNSSLLLTSLYLNTRYNSYWFGYGNWRNDWYQPWWAYRGYGRWYDPIFAYHRWHDGHRHDWDDHWRGEWNRRHRDWDHRWDGDLAGGPGRPGGGRPGDGRPGGRRPGDGRPGDGDGRPGGPGNGGPGNGGPGNGGPGGGRPGDRGDRGDGPGNTLVADVRELSRQGSVTRVRQVTEADRVAARTQIDTWKQLRSARTQAEGSGGTGRSVSLPGGATSQVSAGGSTNVRPGIGRSGSGRPDVNAGGAGGDVQVGGGPKIGGAGSGQGGGQVRTRPGFGRPRGSADGNVETQIGGSEVGTQVGAGGSSSVEQRTGYRGGSFRLPPTTGGVTAGGSGNAGIVPGVGVPGAQTGSPWGSRGPATRVRSGVSGGGSARGGATTGVPTESTLPGAAGGGAQYRTMPGRASRYTPSIGQPSGSGASLRTRPDRSFNGGATTPSIGTSQPGGSGYRPSVRGNFGGAGSGSGVTTGGGSSFQRGFQGSPSSGPTFRSNIGGGGGQGFRSNVAPGGPSYRSSNGGGNFGGSQSFRGMGGGFSSPGSGGGGGQSFRSMGGGGGGSQGLRGNFGGRGGPGRGAD